MNQMRELTLALAQNGTGAGTIAEILDADNFARIKQLANEVENKQEALQQQMQKAIQAVELVKSRGPQHKH